MVVHIPSEERYHAFHSWLSSYHLFSFADYYDPNNMNFGVLRVFNDDSIDGESGFGAHPHSDMEIVTIMLEGELTHKDSIGNTRTMKKGEVQYMSAGTGVIHSEMNHKKEQIHLYQLWFLPKSRGLAPAYDQKDFSTDMRKNELVPVVSDVEVGGAIIMQAEATIYLAELEKGKSITHAPQKGRGVFVYITEGELTIQDVECKAGDQMRIVDEEKIEILANENAKFIVIDVVI